MERKLGVWIVGACGSVATCAVAGAEALRAGVIPTSGLVTELSDFKDLDLVRFDQMVFGGHEIRKVDWVRKNYSVEVHPGFPFDAAQRQHLRGLYHYYLVMSRALEAVGENPFETFDGKKHDWAREIAEQLVKSVKESKMWKNENPAWFEGDPLLTTSYVLVTCNTLLKNVK